MAGRNVCGSLGCIGIYWDACCDTPLGPIVGWRHDMDSTVSILEESLLHRALIRLEQSAERIGRSKDDSPGLRLQKIILVAEAVMMSMGRVGRGTICVVVSEPWRRFFRSATPGSA